MKVNYFLQMIKDLRQHENVILHNSVLKIKPDAEQEVITFLKEAYEEEALNYMFTPPSFNEDAAIWAAKISYTVAQLILYRKHKDKDLALLLPDFEQDLNPSKILSADLCLRFLPDMILELKAIDIEDSIIPLLEKKAETWHYSAINYTLSIDNLNFDVIIADPCIYEAYTERIIAYKNLKLAKHPSFANHIAGHLGDYAHTFWNDFKITDHTHE